MGTKKENTLEPKRKPFDQSPLQFQLRQPAQRGIMPFAYGCLSRGDDESLLIIPPWNLRNFFSLLEFMTRLNPSPL